MSTVKTTRGQRPKGERKSKTTLKANGNVGDSKDIIHATSVRSTGALEEQSVTEKDDGQDEGDAFPCSQKIVPTFRKAKRTRPTEKKMCQDETIIPKKCLKTTGQCKEKSNIVPTIPIPNQAKTSEPDNCGKDIPIGPGQSLREQIDQSNSDYCSKVDPISPGQSFGEQSDQSNAGQIHSSLTVPKNDDAEMIASNLETVADHDGGVQVEEPLSDSTSAMQVREGKLENKNECLTNTGASQVHTNKVKGNSLNGDDNQELSTESHVNTEKINNIGEQSDCINKEPLQLYDKAIGETVYKGKSQQQETCDNISNMNVNHDEHPSYKPPSHRAWKTTEPVIRLVDVLKCKSARKEELSCDGPKKPLNKDIDIVQDKNSLGQQFKTKSEIKGYDFFFKTNNSEMCETDENNVCQKAQIPKLEVIAATAMEKNSAKLSSSCIPTLKVINTGARKQDPGKIIETNTDRSTVETGLKTEIMINHTLDSCTVEAGIETDVTESLPRDKGTKVDVTSMDTLDREDDQGLETGVTSDIKSNIGIEIGVTSLLTVDSSTKTDVDLKLMTEKIIKTDVIFNPTSSRATVEEGVELDISDSQLCAITAMDWTEETLGPAGDIGQSHLSKTKEMPPSIPDGTAIVKGLIRELSHLNMMLLRAKREMQTANQSTASTRNCDKNGTMRAEKRH